MMREGEDGAPGSGRAVVEGGGRGGAQGPPDSQEGSSLVFRGQLRDACFSNPEGFAAFLNRLFSTLNWTVAEFVAMMKVPSPAPAPPWLRNRMTSALCQR